MGFSYNHPGRTCQGKDTEGNVHILHFFRNSVGPEGVAIEAIEFISLWDSLWYLDAKFVGPFDSRL